MLLLFEIQGEKEKKRETENGRLETEKNLSANFTN